MKESKGKVDEQKLIKTYMELTGSTEAGARSVLMYLPFFEGNEPAQAEVDPAPTAPIPPKAQARPGSPSGTISLMALLAASWCWCAQAATGTASPPSSNFITNPISLADAVNLALHQNPSILRSQKDIEATQGLSIQTRAIAIPKVAGAGSYSAAQPSDVDTFQAPGGITFGNDQNWATQIKVVQSFYEGGRILSSFRVAKLLKEQSLLNYQTTVADAVLLVELAYYDVLLAAEQIRVQEASVELLTSELNDTKRRYEAGTVPRFNVLRAEVELANARPRLIAAQHGLRISKNALANLLGFNIPRDAVEDIPLTLSSRLDSDPYDLQLQRGLALALERRPELKTLYKARSLRKEDITSAKAGYKPSLQGFAGYDVHNSMLSRDLTDDVHGWIAGAQLSWNIFDGLLTRGRVMEATANYERAGLDIEDTARRIELEVRTSYSKFIEARDVLESQKKVLEQAEEALRLATARADAGTGTQLDVLSAQTALTDARSTQAQALHDYDAARARLQRAIGEILPSIQGQEQK